MTDGKKYLRRPDTGWCGELEPALLELLRHFLDQAGIPYEVLDNAPSPPSAPGGEGGENTRRRR